MKQPPLCLASSVAEGQAKGFPYRGGKVVVVKKDGVIHIYENRCPHFGINLDFQPDRFFSYDAQYLQCSMHGALFEIKSGDCISGPCRGQPLKKIEYQLEKDEIRLDENFEPTASQF